MVSDKLRGADPGSWLCTHPGVTRLDQSSKTSPLFTGTWTSQCLYRNAAMNNHTCVISCMPKLTEMESPGQMLPAFVIWMDGARFSSLEVA